MSARTAEQWAARLDDAALEEAQFGSGDATLTSLQMSLGDCRELAALLRSQAAALAEAAELLAEVERWSGGRRMDEWFAECNAWLASHAARGRGAEGASPAREASE